MSSPKFSSSTARPIQRISSSRRRRIAVWPIALLLVIAFGMCGWYFLTDFRSNELLHAEVKQAFTRGEYARAAQLGRTLMTRKGHETAGCFITAKALSHQSDVTEAVALFEQVPDDHLQYGFAARVSAGELLLFRAHRLSAAMEHFQRALRIDPYNTQVHERLSYIYGIANLTWRAVPHRMAMLCRKTFGPVHLLLLALGSAHEENVQSIREYYAADHSDPLALCAMARLAMRNNELGEAASHLRRVLELRPEWPEPQAWYGTLILSERNPKRFLEWQEALPAAAADNSEVWFVKGAFAQEQQDLRGAIRCFAESVRCEPNHQAANYQLAQALRALGETERAEPFLRRARLLEDIVVAVKMWQIAKKPEEAINRLVLITTELGLIWEAWGWQQQLHFSPMASNSPPFLPQPPIPISGPATPERVLAAYRVARQSDAATNKLVWDFSSYARPNAATHSINEIVTGDAVLDGEIRFENSTLKSGIDFAYFNGSRPETAGEFMYESTGGGVGSLDYDLDGWPDLYFTQGCDWPPSPRPSKYRDRLYRNVAGERFQDVTSAARLFDHGFGQGLTVGDFDSDGFPDLYVCNIGANRLYHNNGDGTFTDKTEETGVAGDDWSTSCTMADLNGDGMPDIYVVNYVEGPTMFERSCRLADGSPRLCTPYEFQATHDRLYLNLGDGRFRDVSADAEILVPDGKGLGIVTADFDNSGPLSLFVGNDTVPNFFFRNGTARPGDVPIFEELGFVAGLAVDGAGQSQACMGVACGDANEDGLVDLFVTNFYQEANTLYVQQPGLIFSDHTRLAGLYEPGFSQLGFGTQFLDADLDGRLDLVVTNGHVGNLSHTGVPYQMPTQFFRNIGSGKFVELSADRLGDFFQVKHLGRGLARLDWNRDGLDDFAVSHLEESVALMTNQTRTDNSFVSFQVRGVTSARDAMGATVTVTCGQRRLSRQLTAGDGYHASNERRLTFGVGRAARIENVEVRWPSGSTQAYGDLPASSEFLLIEDQPTPVLLSRLE